MEKLIKNTLGQWTLVKNWNNDHKSLAAKWAEGGIRSNLDKLPAATGNLRSKMMSSLSDNTETRINPETSKKEHKLYRAAPVGDTFHEKEKSSWTASPDFAYYWAHNNQTPLDDQDAIESPRKPHSVMHAWIPEEHVHSYLSPVLEDMGHEKAGEHEVIVKPHVPNMIANHQGDVLDKQIARVRKDRGF